MRYLLALLLIVIALPCYAQNLYVNLGHPNAANDPDSVTKLYGVSPDSPWLTPSYAVYQAANGDTINIAGGTDYWDFVPVYGQILSFVGYGDSPVFKSRSDSTYSMEIKNNTVTTATGCIVDGIIFNSVVSRAPLAIINNTASCTMTTYVRNCIFENYDTTSDFFNSPILQYSSSSNQGNVVYYYSCAFYDNTAPCIASILFSANEMNVSYVDNCTFRDCDYAFEFAARSATGINSYGRIYANNCIINADTLYIGRDYDGLSNNVGYLSLDYCDTYGQVATWQGMGQPWGSVDVSVTATYVVGAGNINIDPQFTASDSEFCYVQNAAMNTASSTSGLIGVLWGYYPAAPTPTPTATLNYLYRGMNLMQRFEIIRRR